MKCFAVQNYQLFLKNQNEIDKSVPVDATLLGNTTLAREPGRPPP
jgi:hypothetical protein